MKPIVIQLTNEVVISDPSKSLGDTLQFNNVKPGNFYVFHKTYQCGDEGEKIGQLMAIHEHHLNDVLLWVKRGTAINVSNGLAGIFTKDTYRKDDIFLKKSEYTKGLPKGIIAEGGDWYGHMIESTLNDDKHGTYFKGCVCMTPASDKTYEVHIARKSKRPIAFMVDFDLDHTRYAKYDWWKERKPVTAL